MPFWRSAPDQDIPGDLRLVVGLGNPGTRYAETRHNAGYRVVQELARRHDGRFKGSRHRADVARINLEGNPVLLALPVTYMNESGNAVSRLMSYYRLGPAGLLVVADEMDLPFGTLRLRPRGSAGGNRGMQSIISTLGTEEFPRLRVGVGRPEGSAVGHVLGTFEPDEREHLPFMIEKAADAVTASLRDGLEPAMNAYNRSWLQA